MEWGKSNGGKTRAWKQYSRSMWSLTHKLVEPVDRQMYPENQQSFILFSSRLISQHLVNQQSCQLEFRTRSGRKSQNIKSEYQAEYYYNLDISNVKQSRDTQQPDIKRFADGPFLSTGSKTSSQTWAICFFFQVYCGSFGGRCLLLL